LDFQSQHILHRVLTFVGRQLQQLEIQLVGGLLRMRGQQLVIGHAEMRRGKHLLAIFVVLERAGLSDQGINHVPIVDHGPARAHEPRHLLNEHALVRDGDFLRSDLDIHGPANQSAGDRVHVLSDRDGAALGHAQPFEPLVGIEPMVGQSAQGHLFLKKLRLTMQVGLGDHLLHKHLVLVAAGKVPAAPQEQGLVDAGLQMTVRGFHIAVFVRAAGVGSLGLATIMRHQRLIACGVNLAVRMVVDRRAQAVRAMPLGHATKLPKRLLNPGA
jgi:hypothetical protein